VEGGLKEGADVLRPETTGDVKTPVEPE